jgi:hypothetical protein
MNSILALIKNRKVLCSTLRYIQSSSIYAQQDIIVFWGETKEKLLLSIFRVKI